MTNPHDRDYRPRVELQKRGNKYAIIVSQATDIPYEYNYNKNTIIFMASSTIAALSSANQITEAYHALRDDVVLKNHVNLIKKIYPSLQTIFLTFSLSELVLSSIKYLYFDTYLDEHKKREEYKKKTYDLNNKLEENFPCPPDWNPTFVSDHYMDNVILKLICTPPTQIPISDHDEAELHRYVQYISEKNSAVLVVEHLGLGPAHDQINPGKEF